MREERYVFDVRTVETLRNNEERYQTFSNDKVPTTVQNKRGFGKDTVKDIFLDDCKQLYFAYNKTVLRSRGEVKWRNDAINLVG